jgi:hypothetical protein
VGGGGACGAGGGLRGWGLEETSNRGQDSEEEGHKEGAGLDDEGVG